MKKRSERKISFIVVTLFCVITLKLEAQRPVFKKDGVLPEKFEWRTQEWPEKAIRTTNINIASASNQKIAFPTSGYINLKRPVPADFYVRNFGFFCKKEWEFEKTVHIPLRFRLGSLEYCNYLEGKK